MRILTLAIIVADEPWNCDIGEYRDNWEDGNPASWGTSPQYQVSKSFYNLAYLKRQVVLCLP